jgi:hypothetical protein
VCTSVGKGGNKVVVGIKAGERRSQAGRHASVEKMKNPAPEKKPDGMNGESSRVGKEGPESREVSFEVGMEGVGVGEEVYETGKKGSGVEKKGSRVGEENSGIGEEGVEAGKKGSGVRGGRY